jgi:hypothetical protein
MGTEVQAIQVTGPADCVERVLLAEADLRAAGRIGKIAYTAKGK